MRRRPEQLLHRLLAVALIILAAMHPAAVSHLAQLGTELLLAIVQGITNAATAHPGPAILTAGAIYVAHQVRAHRPRPARAHA